MTYSGTESRCAVYTANLRDQIIYTINADIIHITGAQSGEYIGQSLGLLYNVFPFRHRIHLKAWFDGLRGGSGIDRAFKEVTRLKNGRVNRRLTVLHSVMYAAHGEQPTGLIVGAIQLKSGKVAPSMPAGIKLSRRETQVLFLVAEGYSAPEIADALFIAPSTVVSHRKSLLRKYLARNAAQLVKMASRHYFFQ